MRSIHVDSRESPRNVGSARNTAMNVSCTRSSTSRELPRIRYTVECTRGYSRRNSVRGAVLSRSMHAAMRSPSSAGSLRGTSFSGTIPRGSTAPERLQDSHGENETHRNLKAWHYQDLAAGHFVSLAFEQ